MKKIGVGIFKLGFGFVKLFAVPGSESGEVLLLPKSKGTREIYIGIDGEWDEVVSTLLHEAYEVVLIDLNTRYKQKPSFSAESSDFVFFMTHNQLGEAHERIGEFLVHALPALSTAYKMYHEILKKKKK